MRQNHFDEGLGAHFAVVVGEHTVCEPLKLLSREMVGFQLCAVLDLVFAQCFVGSRRPALAVAAGELPLPSQVGPEDPARFQIAHACKPSRSIGADQGESAPRKTTRLKDRLAKGLGATAA